MKSFASILSLIALPALMLMSIAAKPTGDDDAFAQAVAAYRAARYADALAGFRQCLASSESAPSVELLGNLALAALRERRPADAEPAARKLRELGDADDRALAEFLLGQARFERATLAELAARLPDAEPTAWQQGVDEAQRALEHFQAALRGRGGDWPEALRNAERASRKVAELRVERDAAEQKVQKEQVPQPEPPPPSAEADEQESPPEIAREPLSGPEIARVLARLAAQEREKQQLRRSAARSRSVGQRDW
ncbi:MAG: hypothetical protein NXI31_22630 [bacterium]|nr:hypothetical protein [bacterium]